MLICHVCHHHNPADSLTCAACGSALQLQCPACDRLLPHDARFCLLCGRPAPGGSPDARTAAAAKESARPSLLPPRLSEKIQAVTASVTAERREITVLALEFPQMTRFAGERDAEQVYLLIDEIIKLLVEVILDFDGVVDRPSRDGLTAFFGLKLARENDPERAVRAALEIQRKVTAVKPRFVSRFDFDPGLRIGIHSGQVIAGRSDGGSRVERTVIGEGVQAALALVKQAEPGMILASQSTYQRTKKVIRYERLTLNAGLNAPEAQPVYHPLGRRQTTGTVRGLDSREPPLVGRKASLETLHAHLRELRISGDAAAVWIRGEAGIGKSRLVQAFAADLMGQIDPPAVFRGSGLTPGHSRPFGLFADLMRRMMGIDDDEPPAEQYTSLFQYVESLDLPLEETLPFLALVLDLAGHGPQLQGRLRHLNPDMLQKLIYRAVHQLLAAARGSRPAALVLDDLQWIDADSRHLLIFLLGSAVRDPIFFILISRGGREGLLEELAPLEKFRGGCHDIHLENLDEKDSLALIQNAIPGWRDEDIRLRQMIADRAGGNPFYIEELVQTLIEEEGIERQDGGWVLTSQAPALLQQVPATLQGLILSRYDHLEKPVRELARQAAVFAHPFTAADLAPVAGQAAEQIALWCEELVEDQILVAREGAGDRIVYGFRNSLIQETIYGTLLKNQRRQLHTQFAEGLSEPREGVPATPLDLLAFHYARGLQPEKAIPHLFELAENARKQFANQAAVGIYRQILDLLGQNADPAHFIGANLGLGQLLKLQGVYQEARRGITEALTLIESGGLPRETPAGRGIFIEALHELADIDQREGKLDEAVERLEVALSYLKSYGEGAELTQYRKVIERLVFVLFRQGKLDQALARAEEARISSATDQDLAIVASLYNHLGGIAWQQGNSRLAIFYVEQSQSRYRQIGYPWGIANCYNNLGILYAQSAAWKEAAENWNRAVELNERIGDVFHQMLVLANLAQMYLTLGRSEEVRQLASRGLELAEYSGAHYPAIKIYFILAQLEILNGRLGEARQYGEAGFDLSKDTGSHDLFVEACWILGLIDYHEGETAAGLELVVEGLNQARTMGLTEREGQCFYVQGLLKAQDGDSIQAEMMLRAAEELFRQINDSYWRGRSLLALGRLYLDRQVDEAHFWLGLARTTLLDAATLLDSIGAAIEKGEAEEALTRLDEIEASRGSGRLPGLNVLPRADRRTAAVLWLGFDLPDDLDEETHFEIVTYLLPACATVIQEYDGIVQQQTNGLLAVFGAPIAYEDDAERAVLAARHVLAYVTEAAGSLGVPLQTHLAITHGPLISGELDLDDYSDFLFEGAAREQAQLIATLMPVDRIWVSEAIRAATEHRFSYRPAPYGVATPKVVWELAGLREDPLPARGVPGIRANFIGREDPFKVIQQLADNLFQSGMGGIVWIEGDAGIGKSRLMNEFVATLDRSSVDVWSGRCMPQKNDRAFALFTDLLMSRFIIQPDVDNLDLQHLREQIDRWPADARATGPYLEMLVGVDPGTIEDRRIQELKPEQLRQQTFVAIRRLFRALAREHRLVLILDDLHWIDPLSAELLHFLAPLAASDPILFVCAQRREGGDAPNDRLIRLQSLLPGQTQKLFLERLSPTECQELLTELLPDVQLPARLRDQIVENAGGNPYYLEEFVRVLIEQQFLFFDEGVWRLLKEPDWEQVPVPSSLETLIRSRVDALPEILRETLQSASIIGQNFDVTTLQAMIDFPDIRLALDRLAARLMIRPEGDEERWEFAHTLINSVVYHTMLVAHRQERHLRAARALETRWGSQAVLHAADLAFHFDRGGRPAEALPYLIAAGELAAGRYANEEAIAHFQKAADYAASSSGIDQWEKWRIAVGLGDLYRFVGQYAKSTEALESVLGLVQTEQPFSERKVSLFRRLGETAQMQAQFEEAEHHFKHALDMLDRVDDPGLLRERARILNGLAWVCFARGDLAEARTASLEAAALAEKAQSLNDLAMAENLLGGIYYHLGEWRQALHHTTQGMLLREQMGDTWEMAGSLSNLGILAIAAGQWVKGISFFERSLALRGEIGDAEGLVISHLNLGQLYRDQGELEQAEKHFRHTEELAETMNMPHFLFRAMGGLAETYIADQKLDQARALLDQAIPQVKELGAQEQLTELYAIEAEYFLAAGRWLEALSSARRAARMGTSLGEKPLQVASWRAAATAARHLDRPDAALDYLQQARDILAEATSEVQMGRIELEACCLHRLRGEPHLADEALHKARVIFMHLESKYYLQKLEELAETS